MTPSYVGFFIISSIGHNIILFLTKYIVFFHIFFSQHSGHVKVLLEVIDITLENECEDLSEFRDKLSRANFYLSA